MEDNIDAINDVNNQLKIHKKMKFKLDFNVKNAKKNVNDLNLVINDLIKEIDILEKQQQQIINAPKRANELKQKYFLIFAFIAVFSSLPPLLINAYIMIELLAITGIFVPAIFTIPAYIFESSTNSIKHIDINELKKENITKKDQVKNLNFEKELLLKEFHELIHEVNKNEEQIFKLESMIEEMYKIRRIMGIDEATKVIEQRRSYNTNLVKRTTNSKNVLSYQKNKLKV